MANLAQQIGITRGYFLTRDKGEKAYEYVKHELQQTPVGEPLVLRFPADQLVDSSFADEVAVRLGIEILRGKYGERCLVLSGLTDDSIKNFEAVLSLRQVKFPLLAFDSGGRFRLVGKLEENLKKALDVVLRERQVTASDLAARLGLAINAASTKLKRLHDLHLVRREYDVKGLQYVYYFWPQNTRNF
jgi:DNA-binding transcriptional ArsR family regulator